MEINIQNMSITYSGKSEKVVDLALKLAYKDANSVVDFFNVKTNGLPRSFRIRALRTILNNYVKIAKELDLTSELLYRLNWYPQFSEYQLFKFYSTLSNLPVEKFDEDKVVVDYRTNLWTIILINADKLGIKDNDIKNLLDLGDSHQPFLEYNSILDAVFYDNEQYIDGLAYEEFRDVLFKSSTIIELREIAVKYQINVPKRLTREQLLNLIIEGLKRNNMYDEALGEKLSDYKVISLQRFAKNNNIKASTELKKEEVIDYILNVAIESNVLIQKPITFTPIVLSSEEFEMKIEYIKDIDDIEALERLDVENVNIVTEVHPDIVPDVDKAYVDAQLEKLKKEQEEFLAALKTAEEEKSNEELTQVEVLQENTDNIVEEETCVEEVTVVNEQENLEEDEVNSKEFKEEIDKLNAKFDLLMNKLGNTAVKNETCCEKPNTQNEDRIRELELKIVELSARSVAPSPVSVIFNYPQSQQNDAADTAAMLANAMVKNQPTVVNVHNGGFANDDKPAVEEVEEAEELTEEQFLEEEKKVVEEDTTKTYSPLVKFIKFSVITLLILFVIYFITTFIVLGGVEIYNEGFGKCLWQFNPSEISLDETLTFNNAKYAEWFTKYIIKPIFSAYQALTK